MNPPRNDNRNDNQATIPARPRCTICGAEFTRNRRQRYCSPACRQAAWRARHPTGSATPPDDPHPGRPRREITVYACTECEQRYLAQQWCTDCQRPCRRVDLGGLCPHCDEPVAIIDLLDQHQPSSTHQT
jgi:Zn finger protein HypA/HybF involved in hydrogenase expression